MLSIRELRDLKKSINEHLSLSIKEKQEKEKIKKWRRKKIARPVLYISDSSCAEE